MTNWYDSYPDTPPTRNWWDQYDADPARSRAVGGTAASPGAAAKSIDLSKQTNTPFELINTDPAVAAEQLRARQASEAADHPTVSKYINSYPPAAEVSNDDYPNLIRVAEAAKAFSLSTILDRTVTGFQQGFKTGEPLAFTPEEVTKYPLTYRTWQPVAAPIAALFRLPGGVIGAASAALSETYNQLGGDRSWAMRLERDLNVIGMGLLVESGMGAKPTEPSPIAKEYLQNGRVPGIGVDSLVDTARSIQAHTDAASLDKSVAEVSKSKTLARSPDAFEEFVKNATQQTISIPAEALAKIYESDPEKLSWIPGIEDKITVALETGGDVEISLASYLAKGKDVHEVVRDDVRVRSGGLTVNEVKEIEAYHGSPHDFEAFDTGKIGAGEGAQSYGHGLYFAENASVATEYRDKLASMKPPKLEGDLWKVESFENGDWVERDFKTKEEANSFAANKTGNLYKVRIQANAENFLDWDKPLSEQSPQIQNSLKRAMSEQKWEQFKHADARTAIRQGFIAFHDEEVARKLNEAGIPGIKYLDQGSRADDLVVPEAEQSAKNLTRNYVVFDDKFIQILEKNGEPVQNAIRATSNVEQSSLGLRALFQDAEAAGMTEAQFNAYNKKIQRQVQAIEDRATAIAEREVKKRQTAEWKANEAKERAEVENDLKYRPDLMADYYLRTGLSPNNFVSKGLKLDADLVDVDKLPKGFTSKDGVSPSELAPLFGFSSGEALVRNLQILEAARRTNGETPLQYRKHLVEESVAQRMEAKYGDLQKNIFNEARDLALADLHIDLMDAELRALTEQAKGEPPLSKEELRSWIRGNVGEADLKTASQFDRFQRQAWKASRDTEQALLKGNYIDAAKAKQRQLLSFMLAQEAQKLQKELRSADILFTRLAENNTIASLSQPYLDQIHRILSQIGFEPNRNPGELSQALAGKSLESFVEDKVSAGAELPVSDILYDSSFRSSFETLSVDNFRAIRDSIETLAHNGRAEQTIIKGQQKLDFQQTIAEAVNQVADLDPVIINRHPGFAAKTASWIKEVDASLLKMEQMLRWMDLHDPFGTFSQTVFRPLTEAKHAKNDMMKDLGQKLKAIKNDGKWMKSLKEDIENNVLLDWQNNQPIRLLKKDLIAMMFHTGNESNFKKLTAEYNYEGQKFQWKAEDVNELIARNATKADWDYVQSVWDIFESYWPKVEELSRKMSGIAPDKIEPRTVNTPFGDYKGGYAPVRADPLWPELKSIEKGVFNSQRYFNAVPPKGYTRSRTAAGYPIDLSFESLTETMFQMVHDLAFREPLHNATKFLDNGEIRGAIQRTLGPEYLDQVRPWLENLANSKRISDEALRGINAMARLARERIVTVQMMYRAMTALKHGAAAGLYSIGEVGLKDFTIEANRLWLTFDGRARVSEIFKESGEIRNRLHDADRDIGDALDRTIGESGVRRWLVQNGGIATAALDLGTAIPTYEVAFKRALARGLSKEDAIYDGERAVRDAHGSAGKTDLAAIMQGNEWVKLGTVAYTTFSHNYNRLRDAGRLSREAVADLREGKTDKAYDKFTTAAWRLSWYLLLTAIAEEYIAPIPTKEGEHEGVGKWALKGIAFQLASTIPFLRDGVRSWMYGRNDPAPTPISQIYSQVVGSAKDAVTGKLTKGVGPRRAIESVGYVLGIPGAGQAAATTQFLIDLKRGQQRAESPNKFVWGLISGKSHPEFKIKYGR